MATNKELKILEAAPDSVLTLAQRVCMTSRVVDTNVQAAIDLELVTVTVEDVKHEANEDRVTEFKGYCVAYFAKHFYKPVFYVLTSEADGTIEQCDESREGATFVKVEYAVSLPKSDLGKLKGHRDTPNTIRWLVTKVRDAAKLYADNRYSELQSRAAKLVATGVTRNPPRDFKTFLNDEIERIFKRAKKDNVCSAAEFRTAAESFRAAVLKS